MPNLDKNQRKTVRAIKREGRTISDAKLRRLFERAAVQTGLVEYNLYNRAGGDQDSSNWRQERASIYGDEWARTGGALNLQASVRRFKNEFLQQYDPGEKSYEVAAQVQRPREDLRGRYKDVAGQAAQILGKAGDPAPGVRSHRTQASYETVPGVDNTGLRQSLLLEYLSSSRGKPNALLDLKSGLDSAADIPAKRVKLSEGSGSLRTTPNKPLRGGETTINEILREATRRGLTVGENPKYGGVAPVHAANSFHDRPAVHDGKRINKGSAGDITGDPKALAAFKKWLRKNYGRDLEELIYNAGGGKNLKNGRKVGPGFYSGHTDHLHVADDD